MVLSRLFIILAAELLSKVVEASNTTSSSLKAWHGHVEPGTEDHRPFRPYWVPKGSQSFDDTDPAIIYQGDWFTSKSKDYVEGSLHSTTRPNSEVTLPFTGTGVEWFGNKGPVHGVYNVFLDGSFIRQVSGYEKQDHVQQRLWSQENLPMGQHVLRLVNAPSHARRTQVSRMDVDAFVVLGNLGSSHTSSQSLLTSVFEPSGRAFSDSGTDNVWTLSQVGMTGVHAMQLAVISPTRALVVDKVEHNPLSIDGHPAWAAIYDFQENKAYPIRITSNSFCAGGTFLSNGTMINVGGNPVVEDTTNSADFGDLNGLQSVRILNNCGLSNEPSECVLYENPSRIRLASPRWYNTVVRISDGSAMIIGGSKAGGWINNASVTNPTYEFFPPKGNGLPVASQFLKDTLNANLFPIAFSLPDGRIFMAANQDAMIYDWQKDEEQRLPGIPNGVRVTYPMAGVGLLLPLDPANDYTPEILICGGSTIDDTKPEWEISSQDAASSQCSRMVLTAAGIEAGWSVEQMPQARVMPDGVLLPTGDVFIVNGGQSGIGGYGNVKDQVGQSNCDNPVFTPLLYSPSAAPGSRFSSDGMPASDIPRLYHSVATVVPDGHVLVAGSNPNLDRSTVKYQTEYRVEHFNPPYMNGQRPNVTSFPTKMEFGKSYEVLLDSLPIGTDPSNIKVSLMDLGFVTHSVHANSRLVYLAHSVSSSQLSPLSLLVTAPPSGMIYPPGPAFLFVVVNGIPSEGKMIMAGDGERPPVDEKAIAGLLNGSGLVDLNSTKGSE